MNLFGWTIKRESRNAESPQYPLSYANVASLLGESYKATSGISVTPDKAAQLVTVFACVRVISETLATLPLSVFERTNKGKQKAEGHPVHTLLHDQPNPLMSSVMFREMLQALLLLWGDGLAEIQRDRNGQIVGLWPLITKNITPEIVIIGGQRMRIYRVRVSGGETILTDDQVLHIPGLSFDGVRGKSPIGMAKDAVGLAMAAEEFGARLFQNGTRPSGVFEAPGALSDKAFERLKASLAGHQGLSNAHRTMILEEGMKWAQMSINPDEAQFLETRKFQRSEIAALFRVPPHMIGDLERATFSNIEQQSLDFEKHTMRPWLVRWEQEINRKLLVDRRYFAKFNVDGLLRGDIKTRYEAYNIGRNGGWLSVNDIREREDMNAIDEGDQYLEPLNMRPLGQPDDTNDKPDEGQRVSKRELFDMFTALLKRTEEA